MSGTAKFDSLPVEELDIARMQMVSSLSEQAVKLRLIKNEPRCCCGKSGKRLKEKLLLTTVFRCVVCKKVTSIRDFSIKTTRK